MKVKRKYFIYFVLVAPILTKIFEWILQGVGYGGWSHLANGVWIFQLIFIETMALIVYGIMNLKNKINIQKLMLIPGIAYLVKELYNLIFIYQTFNAGVFIAIFFEPIIMYFLISWVPYTFIFNRKKKGRKKEWEK
jgi:hypothetical protein